MKNILQKLQKINPNIRILDKTVCDGIWYFMISTSKEDSETDTSVKIIKCIDDSLISIDHMKVFYKGSANERRALNNLLEKFNNKTI